MPDSYLFGEFEIDCSRYQLRRNERILKLERIPMELLILLAEKQGGVATRQEIIERIWGKEVFVDTEHGINTAIRKIRAALREDAEHPRFVMTIQGKGYRLAVAKNGGSRQTMSSEPEAPQPRWGNSPQLSASQQPMWGQLPSAARQSESAGRRIKVALAAVAILVAGVLFNSFRSRIFPSSVSAHIRSIAVLPLANLSGDKSQDYFADGMTDELITSLAKNRNLRVVSRTSVMQYKGASQPLREIAQALGVDGILEGSVNRSANHVHINLQLIYAPTDTHVWAQSYDRDLNGTLSLPQEISQVTATEAKVPSAPPKSQRYVSPEAHDAYLQGRDYWFSGNYVRSKEYFEKAIRLQPDYALAWDGLGDSYGASAVEGRIPAREAFEKEEQYARKALALDELAS